MWTKLQSKEDSSINFYSEDSEGLIESRFVQRSLEYFIVYLSSHNGCNQTCRFCHLTATGQTTFSPVTPHLYWLQAKEVLNNLPKEALQAKTVHFNFMARGEPLANPYLVKEPSVIFDTLKEEGQRAGFTDCRYLVSTIFPELFSAFRQPLSKVLEDPQSSLYYSLYSVDPTFRKKWLPRAMDPFKALDEIAQYQQLTGKQITLHWAFIEGENDSVEDLHKTMQAVTARGLDAKFNLVRYNPYSSKQGKEVSETTLQELFSVIEHYLPNASNKIVSRVGFDVKASCGMFIESI